MQGELITAPEAARRLGITPRTLWRWRDDGKISEAGRAGRSVLFDAAEVDRLRQVDRPHDITLFEVYSRLIEADEWGAIDRLRRDIAATICTQAKDKTPVERAWRAACAMAATRPEGDDSADRWRDRALTYEGWLGKKPGETDAAIEYRSRKGSKCTKESAEAEMRAAPRDPAAEIASLMMGK